jgi:hypothetical protein
MVVRSTCPPHSRGDSRRLAFRKTVQRGASEDTLGDVSTVFDETPLALFWSSDCLAVWLSGQATSILTFDAAAVDWTVPAYVAGHAAGSRNGYAAGLYIADKAGNIYAFLQKASCLAVSWP